MDNFKKAEAKFIELEKLFTLLNKAANNGIITHRSADLLIHEIDKETDPNKYKKP